jgi:hypothetical protein
MACLLHSAPVKAAYPKCSGKIIDISDICTVSGVLEEIIGESGPVSIKIRKSTGIIIELKNIHKELLKLLDPKIGDSVIPNATLYKRAGAPYYGFVSAAEWPELTLERQIESERTEQKKREAEFLARRVSERQMEVSGQAVRLDLLENTQSRTMPPAGHVSTTFTDTLGPKAEVSGNKSANSSQNENKSDWSPYLIGIWIAIAIIGAIMGYNEAMVVFRDFNDLGLVFLTVVVPILFACFQHQVFGIVFLASEICLLCSLLIRTIHDNQDPLLALLALLTKIPLSILFVVNVITLLSSQGKTQMERTKAGISTLSWLSLVTRIIYGLVQRKDGLFSPQGVLSGHVSEYNYPNVS